MSKKKLLISVRDIITYSYRAGDLNLESFDGSALDGIRIHSAIQKTRGEDYTSEVSISTIFGIEDYSITVYGRVDGIFNSGVIEEIETTDLNINQLDFNSNLQNVAQLKIYCYMFLLKYKKKEVIGRLTYYSRKSQSVVEFDKVLKLDELKKFVDGILDTYLKWIKMTIDIKSERDETIKNMKFPFETCRDGQEQMMKCVRQSIENKKNYIIEAPTGIGKSISTIYPAIEKLTEGIDKIFYLTAKNSGFKSSSDALFVLKNRGLKLKSLTLTSKDKVCVNLGASCNAKECGFAAGFFDRVNEAVLDILQENDIDTITINKYAMKHYICPFEFALILTDYADVIICDYNYVFDPRVAIKRLFEENSDQYIFLVDEAHNLVDRARNMFSATINLEILDSLILEIASQNIEIVSSLRNLVDEFVDILDISRETDGFVINVSIDELINYLKDFATVSERWLVKGRKREYRSQLIEAYFQAYSFLNIYELYDDKYSVIVEKYNGETNIVLFNIDPSINIGISLEKAVSTIFFSATIIPKEYYSYMFSTSDNYLTLDSPYDKENHRVISASYISTYYNDRDDSVEKIALLLNQYLSKNPGNTLVYFPSYSYMNQFWEYFQYNKYDDYSYVIQFSGMTYADRADYLQNFDEENSTVGFAVMGGVFGEGIDLQGVKLTGVFVIGVGLPGLSIFNRTIQEYFESINFSGFEYAFTYPGFVKVLQATGRVIRGENDRGVITIIDKRYGYKIYNSMYPKHWNYQKSVSLKQYNYFLNKFFDK